MKNIFKAAALALAMIVGLSSCINDKNETVNDGKTGKETTIKLVVKDGIKKGAVTRAADTATEAPEDGVENVITDEVYVFIFKSNGDYEYSGKLAVTTNVTEEFTITTGDKYIYVFSDPGEVLGLSTYVGNTTLTAGNFEKLPITDAVANIKNATFKVANVADSEFVNGTLWGEIINIAEGDTNKGVNVGRMVAKVELNTVDASGTGVKTAMKGTFTDPQYKIGSVASKTNLVGQFEKLYDAVPNLIIPPYAGHGQVYGALYDELFHDGITPGPDYVRNPLFVDFDDYENEGTAFYVNENSNSMTAGFYYQNTTHILFRAVYTPHADEVMSGADPTQTMAFSGTDYWTGYYKGQLVLFGEEPSAAGITGVKKYDGGMNYYEFAIRDRDEEGIANQCRVLRNHFYDITVEAINSFGKPENDKEIKVPTTIDDEVDLTLTITVLPWAKVSQSEIL